VEPLFRLTLIRPAVNQDESNPSIDLAQDTPLQKALEDAAKADKPREALREAALEYTAGPDYVPTAEAHPLSAELAEFRVALGELENAQSLTHAQVEDAVQAAFGESSVTLAGSADVDAVMQRLKDSLLAIKQVQEEHGRPIADLTQQLRDLELVHRLAEDAGFPASPAELRRYRRRSLKLPLALKLTPALSTAALEEKRRKEREEAEAKRQEHAQGLLDVYRGLQGALSDLTGLGKEHLQTTPQQPHEGVVLPEKLFPTTVLTKALSYQDALTDLNLGQFKAAIERHGSTDPLIIDEAAGGRSAANLAKGLLSEGPRLFAGSPAFRPAEARLGAFCLKASAGERLPQATRDLLDMRGLVITEQPLDQIVGKLQAEIDGTGQEIDSLFGKPVRLSIRRFGDTLVKIKIPVTDIAPGPANAPLPIPGEEHIPRSHGTVAPAGVADLIIVKQQLTAYEGGDVAHIENVLKGERKNREHSRRQETEEFSFRETETTSSQERELESTNRFEMTRESNAVIKEDSTLKAGLNVSGKYGPTVDFSASVEGSTSRSKEEATKAASSFSQEVTERSASKITERVLERASLRVTNEIIEKNLHELDNRTATGHVSGVYQWVNKVYQAQMFNYGQRTIFEFMVPEPAAFLIDVLNGAHASAVELEKPPEFTLLPSQVSDNVFSYGYYGRWMQLYGATDVSPPPEYYRTKSLDFSGGGSDAATNYYHSGQIAIDDGYKAVHGTVGCVNMMWNSSCIVDVMLGSKFHRFANISGAVFSTGLSEERDSIPFGLVTFSVPHLAVAVEVKCQRTERAMEKWRVETHAKLTTAYKARLSEYEEKFAALQVQQGIAIRGKNPLLNLEIMNDELKKNCISILTDQHYDLFGAVGPSGTTGLPQIDIDEAEIEGAYVRFFEQAFEWEQMTWVTYPYFWGRKHQWDERLAFEDPDPLFNQFLKAGFCRVSVPARPGFEGAIDHFITYGELWMGGPLPTISSPLFLPIADELAERLDAPGKEVPQGEPWEVRIPTTLVKLRPDDKLPKWVQLADGRWAEEP
jgi:hypothetical protein